MAVRYKRILLKLSGEVLAGGAPFGIDPERTRSLAEEIREVHQAGVEIGIVIGGGNFFRGAAAAARRPERRPGGRLRQVALHHQKIAGRGPGERGDRRHGRQGVRRGVGGDHEVLAPGPRQDHHANLAVIPGALKGQQQLFHCLGAKSVAHVGAVDGDSGNPLGARLVEEILKQALVPLPSW